MTPTVALIGANGHGRWHRRRIAELTAAGLVRLVGLADPAPLDPDPAVPEGVPVFTDHRALLDATRPDVAIICTPPHTHLRIAMDALLAGCDLLLEKPPVVTPGEHDQLLSAVRHAGRACQVGFQALGSAALARLLTAVRGGELGAITGIATVASWQRDDAYYARAPWAGRQRLDGRRVLDGALVNPLAHALMQSLVVAAAAGAGPAETCEAERYRTRPIETDDTTFARITFRGGLRLVAAVTLAGEEFIPGEVIVTGTAGRAVLEYPTDRLRLPGDAELREVPGRADLLTNLVAHRRDPAGVPLLAPLDLTGAFTAVAAALTDPERPTPVLLGQDPVRPPTRAHTPGDPPGHTHAPLNPPVQARTPGGSPSGERIDDAAGESGRAHGEVVRSLGEPPARVQVIAGINALLRRVAETEHLPSELGVPWAARSSVERLLQTAG